MKQSLWQRTKYRVAAFRRSPAWSTFVGTFWALTAWSVVYIAASVVVQVVT